MTYQLESEGWRTNTRSRSSSERKHAMVQKLETAPVTGSATAPFMAGSAGRCHARSRHRHNTRYESVITGIFLPSWRFREYTLGEKVNLWRGKFFSQSILRDKMFATDLTKQVTALDLPVYFLHGRYDYTCSYTLAKAYFEQLKAPLKGFYTFEQSAHSPLFEEPGKVRDILQEDVLAGMH